MYGSSKPLMKLLTPSNLINTVIFFEYIFHEFIIKLYKIKSHMGKNRKDKNTYDIIITLWNTQKSSKVLLTFSG